MKLYGVLRRHRPAAATGAPHHPFSVELVAGATVADLTAHLAIDAGIVNAMAVNGDAVDEQTPLVDGDEVSLFPPAAGGESLHVFLAGVMQGSRQDHLLDEQDYRATLTQALQRHVPNVRITDPLARDPNSVNYDLTEAREAFFRNTAISAEADVLIAYLPEASMGTAIEMWTAKHNNTIVVAVTPLKHNWVVLLTADRILPDLESLLEVIEGGRFVEFVGLGCSE